MVDLTPNPGVCLLPRHHRLRGAAEACAARIYDAHYGARLEQFPDMMATLPSADGGIRAVAGIRLGPHGFFSEAYLDRPVESRMAEITGIAPARQRIVEYSTLAAVHAGSGGRLIRALVHASLAWGCEWSFFTATAAIRLLLAFHRIPFHILAMAHPARIADSRRWGNYYEHDPQVCAVWRGDLAGQFRLIPALCNHAPQAAAVALNA